MRPIRGRLRWPEIVARYHELAAELGVPPDAGEPDVARAAFVDGATDYALVPPAVAERVLDRLIGHRRARLPMYRLEVAEDGTPAIRADPCGTVDNLAAVAAELRYRTEEAHRAAILAELKLRRRVEPALTDARHARRWNVGARSIRRWRAEAKRAAPWPREEPDAGGTSDQTRGAA